MAQRRFRKMFGAKSEQSLDRHGNHANKGPNPFDKLSLNNGTNKRLSSLVNLYDPDGWASTDVYAKIKANIADWVEEAIEIRSAS